MLASYIARKGKLLDWLIGLRHLGKYSHSELVFSDGDCFTSSWRDGGCRMKRIDVRDGKWDLQSLPVDKEQEYRIRVWCAGQLGKNYDLSGVLAYVNPFRKQDENKLYCSEACCLALQQVGLLEYVDAGKVYPTKLRELVAKGVWHERGTGRGS